MTDKVWFITGASRGFGMAWTRDALARGDSVAAAVRDTSALTDLVGEYGERLLPLPLDVTDRDEDLAAVKRAHDHFGRLDIVVNNAGYGQFGCIEELSEEDIRKQMETNLYGAVWITQAALPYLRQQGSGHIIQVSSGGGLIAVPDLGIYHASKFALEGFSEALAAEVKSFGIYVTLIEPGVFATDWAGSSAKRSPVLPAYVELHAEFATAAAGMLGEPGNPAASGRALMKIVDVANPPLRAIFGSAPLDLIKAAYADRLDGWEEWQSVAILAHG
jgi:NAD(P)-dependent dehydrogenase (short-subunit alcohol dehydrogenase family)